MRVPETLQEAIEMFGEERLLQMANTHFALQMRALDREALRPKGVRRCTRCGQFRSRSESMTYPTHRCPNRKGA